MATYTEPDLDVRGVRLYLPDVALDLPVLRATVLDPHLLIFDGAPVLKGGQKVLWVYDTSTSTLEKTDNSGLNFGIITSADATTTVPLNNYFFKDAGHVYYEGRTVLGADPASFHVLGGPEGVSGADAHSVYYTKTALMGVDPASATATGPYDIADKNAIYIFGSFDSGDPGWQTHATKLDPHKYRLIFSSLYQAFISDSTDVYRLTAGSSSQEALHTNPTAFRMLSGNYSSDGRSVWYSGNYDDLAKLPGADASTFVPINPKVEDNSYGVAYGKDASHVYRRGTLLDGADPATFEAELPNDQYYYYWSKDATHVYYEGKLEPQFDAASFRVLNDGSQKDCGYLSTEADKNGVYSGLEKMPGADPATYIWEPPSGNCGVG